MRKLLAILILLPILAVAADRIPTSKEAWAGAQPQLKLSVKDGAVADTFNVHAVISDRRTGRVLGEPSMLIRAGAWAKAEIGASVAPGDASVSLAVTVDPSGKHVAYFAEIRRVGGTTDTESGTLLVSR